MQQLARKKVCVFYSSLAGRSAARRSVIADSISKHPARKDATVYFEIVPNSIITVQLCRPTASEPC